jgi:acetyl-CoA acyltransferase
VAYAQIASGVSDCIVAGGAESMTRVPMGGNRDVHGVPFGWRLNERFALTSQGEAAERLCDLWNLTREQLDDFALTSQARAARAADAGFFDREIVPVDIGQWCERGDPPVAEALRADETIRRDTSRERLASLKASFRPEGGRVTAGNASQISDGAAGVLLMAAERAQASGLQPRARIRAVATVGSDPVLMLTGPIAATRKVLERAGLTLDDIDLFEVNEAFAPVPLIWMQEFGIAHDRVNVNGGAIALGHPLGASGARIMTSMLHELERRKGRFALQTICCAGGLGTATIIERLG